MIRPIALAVIRRGDELLVFEGRDSVKRQTFYRPLGGGIEFGETAEVAVRRELREELAVDLDQVTLLGVVENIFQYQDAPGHEIVFLHTATIADPAFYHRDHPGTVLDSGSTVVWLPIKDVIERRAILYPCELAELF
jgi:ADP-ribose pyrophosphatase YjhB (NUDIX family)